MGNVITDAAGKIASNVTQSVVSALIVTAVTTYFLVSPGKDDKKEGASGSDSAKATTEQSSAKPGTTKEISPSGNRAMDTANPENPTTEKEMNTPGNTQTLVIPTTETKKVPVKTESPVTESATKTFKELPTENPTEENLEPTIAKGRAKGDSLAKASPHADKASEIKKPEKKELKDVKKAADDAFDELDSDTKK
jgi:hypothetical protein